MGILNLIYKDMNIFLFISCLLYTSKAMLSGAQTIEADVLQGTEVLFQEVGFAEAGASVSYTHLDVYKRQVDG